MKTPDEIKKGLSMCSGETRRTCSECPYYLGEACCDQCESDALAYIRQLEAEKPRWISVEDRLPETTGRCLALFEDGRVADVGYDECIDDGCRFGEWIDIFEPRSLGFLDSEWNPHDGITHWMPLPEPPKDDKEEAK